MPNVLIVGATRGLGFELAQYYAKRSFTVTGTARSSTPPENTTSINWIPSVDIATETAGQAIVSGLKGEKQDIVIITAGFFPSETLDELDWEAELKTYKICAIGPLFVVQALWKAGLLAQGRSKVVLVSSEAGSIGLRHESEGGAMYAHHASKAALNMVGRLLSLNLKEDGVAVGMVHPGFMRTEMTKGVGFDKVCCFAFVPPMGLGSCGLDLGLSLMRE